HHRNVTSKFPSFLTFFTPPVVVDITITMAFNIFKDFTPLERWNLTFYILGIMIYKFALETMNACMSGIILNRLGYNSDTKKAASFAPANWTAIQSINVVMQCIGSLAVGPLVKRMRPGRLMAGTIMLFGLTVLIVPIMELASGGKIPRSEGSTKATFWGSFSPYALYAIFPIAGIFHGIVELMRRVVPNDIVGGDALKLRRMDSLVHICYEITGTSGAFLSLFWITYFGWGYALAIMPIGYSLAAFLWYQMKPRPERLEMERIRDEQLAKEGKKDGILSDMGSFFVAFFHNITTGAKLVCSQRALIWLVPSYTLPLVLHRYLENTLNPFYAKSILEKSDYQQILTGGSNFGELLGAFVVLIAAKHVKTPIPWLRLDAIMLMLVWILPFVQPSDPNNLLQFAWTLAPIMALISFGWAAGDVSLAAYVQSRLAGMEKIDAHTSPLGAVMAFLYVSYLVVFTIANNVMGTITSSIAQDPRGKFPKPNAQRLFIYIGGVFMTVCGVIVIASTFIPRGAFAFNPDPDTVQFDDHIDIGSAQNEKNLRDLGVDPESLKKEEKEGKADIMELVTGA
ncbi:hypothetical protein HK102_005022, partial [Quaeritorhiza haematococci]